MKYSVFTGSLQLEANSPQEAAKEFWRQLHSEQNELLIVVDDEDVIYEFEPRELI
jgi:hypothetical protein